VTVLIAARQSGMISHWSVRVSALLNLLIPVLAWADAAQVAERLDQLFAARDDPAVSQELEGAVGQSLRDYPDEYEVLWRAARYKQWLADGTSDERLKKQFGKEAWELGERAIRQDPNRVEGHYFSALGLGSFSRASGILKALGQALDGQFNEKIEKAIHLAPSFLGGAPLVAKARYYYELPWPKRSLKKSAELFAQAIQMHPENLRAYVYLAETQLKDGNAKLAKETVTKALSGSVDYDPPEGRRSQQLAKRVAAVIEEELK
jgi:tetratricopeptide (TPR) repeat protein